MGIEVGDMVVYQHRSNTSGRKHTCIVSGFQDGWVLDINSGTHASQSFRPDDVIIWEHRKRKGK